VRYCPTCSHVFEDDSILFCPNDGMPVVDQASLSQVSSAQPLPRLAPAPDLPDIDSEDFDPEITLSRGQPKIQETMFPSESLNEAPQELVSAVAGVQPGIDGKPPQSNLSEPSSRSQPALRASLQSSPAESHPNLQASAQPSQPESAPRLQPKSKPGRKRRLALLLIVVLVILLIPPVGAFFWWQHFKSSPAYYLAMLVDAVHRNDKATVNQIVAMDQITDNFASQVTQSVLSQNSSAAADADRKKLESSLTAQAPTIKQKVQEEVEKQVKDEAALSTGKSLLTIALALYYKGGIKQTGNTATVAPQAHPVSWTLQRSDAGAWTIVALKDDALASQIQDQVTGELPTTGEKTRTSASKQKNAPASKQSASSQQRNSARSSRAKKKESKKPEKGFRIELPFPDLQIELRPAPRN
jgi:flagellar basal body-associated protein FliL